jgi:transcriptional regulator with XRE-family HTH domain
MMESYAQKIRSFREKKDISQEDAATAIGVTRPTYSAIETGKRELTLKELHLLCNLLGITIQQFLFSSTQVAAYESRMDKYKQLILNCLQFGVMPTDSNMSKAKLAALVYMCDFASYYDNKVSMSVNLSYRHAEYGPIVDAYYRMIDELYDEGAITIELRGRAILVSANEPSAPRSLLRDEELQLIHRVCKHWQDQSTQAVIEFVKSQTPWKLHTQGEIIQYASILEEPVNPFTED